MFIDHLSEPPRRIVSLVPSQTELLADLGLDEAVVGITKFCVHPQAWFQSKTRVGGTKTLNLPRIAALKPDLILGNREENEKEQVEWLAERFPVWISDVHNLEDALDMIARVGALTHTQEAATGICTRIRDLFDKLPQVEPSPAAYLIWRKPYMVAGGDTFIHDMMRRAGFSNVFGHLDRYPQVSLEQLAAAQPHTILLSSEPYPFSARHFREIQEACPAARVRLVDGEMFSWYGSRLLQFSVSE